ncbi:uncharacterized protein LOC122955702 isoform X1 [Acropora millepora]|uniref:uncharacterized protein LOC122955702 isoform X1 n=2 Tax=Acropora millepora TaxID=45264 RepID=UPI001CF40E03|nr:uncharacterized protein LOC122955702 isoform X1 [Acropora millepora]
MSDSDYEISSSASISSDEQLSSDSSEEMEVLGQVQPYADEPPAHTSDEEEDAEEDQDGFSPAVLRSRLEREVPLNDWCKCEECTVYYLTDAVEYRCCREIAQASQKLMFDGSIERISCITQHEDYSAMTNRSVLSQVAPLLRDRNGRGYRRRDGQTQNQFLRAVAYRWLVRWMCGYLGWDNTRPLPACVYDDIRKKFQCTQVHGYQSAEQRN